MTIKVGDRLPAGTLMEYHEVEKDGCPIGPESGQASRSLTRGKKVVIFGLARRVHAHLLGQARAELSRGLRQAQGEGRRRHRLHVGQRRVRDGRLGARAEHRRQGAHARATAARAYTKALGLELDLTARGMGVRCQRFSMLVDDGVVKTLNVEAPGKFEVSDAETMLTQLG